MPTTIVDLQNALQVAVSAGNPDNFVHVRASYISDNPQEAVAKEYGAESPAETLRKFSALMDREGKHVQGWKVIELAVQLEPENVEILKTRGLVAMSNLNIERAREIFEQVKNAGDPMAGLLQEYLVASFPDCLFAPIRFDGQVPPVDVAGNEIKQSLEEIQKMVGIYATRLTTVKLALIGKGADQEAAWMIPEMTALLPDGPLKLRRFSYSQWQDDPDAEVEANEEINMDAGALELVNTARGDWAALTLMLWLLGKDELSLPQDLVPREGFESKLEMAQYALWLARDKQLSNGKSTIAQGFSPNLKVRNLDIGEIFSFNAQLIAADFASIQAMLKWLTGSRIQSPFTDGLRDS